MLNDKYYCNDDEHNDNDNDDDDDDDDDVVCIARGRRGRTAAKLQSGPGRR